jgi:lipopolysaccharide export LptBFGC system permease protein LptF
LIVGYLSVCKVLVLCLCESFGKPSDEARAVRAFSIAGVAMIGMTVLLLIPPVMGRLEFVTPIVVWLLVPQALPLAIPVGLVVGLAYAVNRRVLTADVLRMFLVPSLLCSIVSFAMLIWAMPAANQEFRQQLFTAMGNRGRVGKGLNELTLSELRNEITIATEIGNQRRAREVAWSYHLKSSLASASFVLCLFAAALNWSHSGLRGVLVLLSPLAYWALLMAGEALGRRTSTPALISAWLPNIVLVTAATIVATSVLTNDRPSTDHV